MDINTNLFNYILNQEWDILKKIITDNKEIDLNIRDESNNYLIQFIIVYNKIDLIDLFIERKCKMDIIDNDGKTLLFYAIKFNYFKMIEKLITINYIGVPLLELKDKNKNYPIHYAVMSNNLKIIDLLISKKIDINIKDNNSNTPLMLAVKNKNKEIIKFLLDLPAINVNIANNVCQTALHIACNYELESIVDLILENKNIEPNIQDKENKYTPLMISVTLNNYNLINSLLNHPKNNLYIQDSRGNTSYHLSIQENNSEDIIKLFDIKIDEIKPFNEHQNIKSENYISDLLKGIYNLTNIYGYTILHLLLANNIQINLKKYIENTNLNIQTNQGNTIWHLFDKKWLNYIPELILKKNNVFIKNRKNEIVFDKYKDNDKFIDILIRSYHNYLKTKKKEWNNDWENICKNNDILKKIDFKDNMTEKNCYEKIKKNIIENNVSVPYKKSNYCIILENLSVGDVVTYTGTSLDILVGLLFIKKFDNVFTSLTKKFIFNNELNEYYKVLGIIKEIKGEYMNFEITWLYQKLFFPDNMESVITNFKSSQKRFLIIPLGIHLDNEAHANTLIYDNELNEMERFEPAGGDYPREFNYNPELLDYYLKEFFSKYFTSLKYFKPKNYEFTVGFQTMETIDIHKKNIGDPGGFCGAWSVWWAYMRIKNPTIDRRKLFIQLVKSIRKNNFSFKNVIRSFSKQIIEIRDNLLKKVSLDINKWLHDDFTFDTFDRFNVILEKLI
jgi:ankyrin repeat protein